MKTFLYIILGLVSVVILFFGWFHLIFLQVPDIVFEDTNTQEENLAELDSWFTKLQEANKFNGSVAIIKDREPIMVKSYGFTDHTMSTPLTADSSMRLASVSKQFTATGIMILNEQGKLEYDNMVTDYIPEFPFTDVSVRHLLNQTSGIPDVYMKLANDHKDNIELLTNEKVLDLLISENITAINQPNEVFQYSNTNYVLLSLIIERVSGQSFENFMQQNLFTPLEMKNSRVWNLFSPEKDFPNRTYSFDNFRGARKEIKPGFLDGVSGDGSVFSSLNDMITWDDFWYENNIISQENLTQALTRPTLNNGTRSDYGFGWLVTDEGMWHTGGWLGARTVISQNKKNGVTYIILDNSASVFFDQIHAEIDLAVSKI